MTILLPSGVAVVMHLQSTSTACSSDKKQTHKPGSRLKMVVRLEFMYALPSFYTISKAFAVS